MVLERFPKYLNVVLSEENNIFHRQYKISICFRGEDSPAISQFINNLKSLIKLYRRGININKYFIHRSFHKRDDKLTEAG